ncbi:2-amino-4-hydroxy-6-hydroxymethyldihydropteridine diphosphokinase [Blattabacterium cuenoti]|uniref:2-amino-4-hydroxy-6-hydroxymethyldihydropteridine pyrophosphokinase n=1 Tax=Blattabacterium cuenoti STAT TaxID=1457030 RepID=A0A224AIH3_9FLAO|nr:2-amino-4-hydroxy-6-hydroxymethyldihydropteridine diphosphokinase [Blattabacterium cuenoti]BBA16961.1 2-amino-4-hydroxy-6-hydroxymethyldihydropteridine pyrophosphokinase [Blattabacterium cuenoti STAT]
MKKHDVFLLQGSNKGNKKKYLDESLILMSNELGKVVQLSSYFESEAWNMKNYSIFYNRALHLKTDFSPIDLLKKIWDIEFFIGRKKNSSRKEYQNREIDIDILFYDRIIIYSFILKIPHPLLHLRRFVLEPMCEISPNKNHPIFNLTILEILGLCIDKLYVKKISE